MCLYGVETQSGALGKASQMNTVYLHTVTELQQLCVGCTALAAI